MLYRTPLSYMLCRTVLLCPTCFTKLLRPICLCLTPPNFHFVTGIPDGPQWAKQQTENPKWSHLGNPLKSPRIRNPISDPLKSYIGPIWEAITCPHVCPRSPHETGVGPNDHCWMGCFTTGKSIQNHCCVQWRNRTKRNFKLNFLTIIPIDRSDGFQ